MLTFLLLNTGGDFWSVTIPLWAVVAWVVFMCAVQALPRPSSNSPGVYVFLYQFGHLLALNLALVFDPKKKLPQVSGEDLEKGLNA